jgi:hypothetical protein
VRGFESKRERGTHSVVVELETRMVEQLHALDD